MDILSFSLVEWLLFGFIGMNMTLSAAFLIQRGVQRLSAVEAADKE